jgi:hypothetical protein
MGVGDSGRVFSSALADGPPRSALALGEWLGELPVPQPTIEKRRIMPESPVNWGTSRGIKPLEVAGLNVDA